MSKIIAAHNVKAIAQGQYYAFVGNSYYGHLAQTPSVYSVRIHETVNGEFFVDATYADAHEGVHSHYPSYRSNAFATLDDAKIDANRVWLYLRDEFVSEYGAQALTTVATPWGGLERGKAWTGGSFGGRCPLTPGVKVYEENRSTYCTKCERFDTLTTKDTGYGWATDCPCGFNVYTSSGD